MTTPSTPRKAGPLLGTGAQTSWPFTFKVFAASDIAVTIANNLGVETALVLNTDYSVTLNSNQDTSPGGTVTYPISGSALPTGSKLTIIGNLPYDQPLDLPSGGNFSPLALENELDRLTMQIQQLREQVGRSLTVPVTSGVSPSLPSPAASNLIGWNENGDNLENYPLSELATSLAFATYRYDTFTGNGSTTQFTLSADPVTLGNLDVAVGGVTQTPGTDYLLVAGVLEFTSAPPNGATILARFGEGIASGPSMDSYDVRFRQAGTGSVDRTAEEKLRDQVCVFDFMTPAQISAVKAQTSTEDLSIPFQQAINTSKRVYIPKGRYRANVQIDSKTILEGDGSQSTILQPYNDAVAIMTYTFTAQQTPAYAFWDYHSEVHGIGFWGKTTKTGVGFTFGKTNPTDYQTNDEYANNVKFFGCRFHNLEKGVQFPFGNIGTEFYSCGFSANKYGVYSIDNKFPAGSPNIMHAGNKYFYAGEFSGNFVGVYINNALTDGFGGIAFYGTIIEGNLIGIYAYISPRTLAPISLNEVWFEANGLAQGGTSVIDSWSGATVSNQTVTNRTIIIDGDSATDRTQFNIQNGVAGDIYIKSPKTQVVVSNSRVESQVGFGGGPFTVDNPDTSWITFEDVTSDGGWYGGSTSFLPYVSGLSSMFGNTIAPGGRSTGRCFQTNQRGSKVTNYGSSRAMSSPLTSAASLTGSFSLTGSVVSDGRLYNQCNQFTRSAFLSSQFEQLSTPATAITTSAGWYAFTLDMKIVSGAGVAVNIWDQSTASFVTGARVPSVGKWYTLAAVGYSAGGQSLFLDFSGLNGDVTWRVSAYQIHRFDTEQEAWNFIHSNVFAES